MQFRRSTVDADTSRASRVGNAQQQNEKNPQRAAFSPAASPQHSDRHSASGVAETAESTAGRAPCDFSVKSPTSFLSDSSSPRSASLSLLPMDAHQAAFLSACSAARDSREPIPTAGRRVQRLASSDASSEVVDPNVGAAAISESRDLRRVLSRQTPATLLRSLSSTELAPSAQNRKTNRQTSTTCHGI